VPLVGSIANFNQDHIWLQLQGEENSKGSFGAQDKKT